MFENAGFECPEVLTKSRKLIFENEQKGIRYFWVKPSDVAIYVERGAADIGVCGKDILIEYDPAVYELLDMNMGKCRMAVAAPKDFKDDLNKTLDVLGYHKGSSIRNKKYKVLTSLMYPVDDCFPRIVPESFKNDSIPNEVGHISYEVNLHSLNGTVIDLK